jgi:serine/threonine-protein kinase RsbW
MELSFPNELGYEVVARDAVAAFARRIGLPPDRIEDLKTAFCEACINAIEHGNSLDPALRVQIVCRYQGDRFEVDVCDEGRKAFAQVGPPIHIADKLAGIGSLRGMGLMLISQLSDESGFIQRTNGGNCFRFAFYRQAPQPGSVIDPGYRARN